MEDEEKIIQEQITQEADNSLYNTLWGGYANSIITGLQKNPSIQPDRPIWELVQNARDVSLEGGKAKIVFTRKKDSFVFKHNGQPFSRDTLIALILQTSSKVRHDIIQVGQYGTGFLTTHKFGLDFRLSGSLSLANGTKYYDFSKEDFTIKRSEQDKKLLSKELDETVHKTQEWGKDSLSWTDEPIKETTFEYIHTMDAERENVRIAIKEAPKLVPYVLALNRHIESICFEDEVDRITEMFSFMKEETYEEFEQYRVSVVSILHSTTNQENTIIPIYLLRSTTSLEEKTGESKFTIILPFEDDIDELKVFSIGNDIPRLFLYLPLLGSKDWGINFIMHSPGFVCDQDTRDTLMLQSNHQTEEQYDKINKEIISEANNSLKSYLNYKYSSIKQAKLLSPITFIKGKGDDEVGQYFKSLQTEWVSFFEKLYMVEKEDGSTIDVRSISVLNKEINSACEQDSDLLDAIYSLLSKPIHKLALPKKEDLLFWSSVTEKWYDMDEKHNPHELSTEAIVSMIQLCDITGSDLNWLHKILEYFKIHCPEYLNKPIIPNETLSLCAQKDLVKPANFGVRLRNVLSVLSPDTVKRFVHSQFMDIVEEGSNDFVNADINIALSGYFENLPIFYENLKSSIIANNNVEGQKNSVKRIPTNEVHAILELYKILIANSTGGFPERCYVLMSEYYKYQSSSTEIASKDIFDVRKCYNALINDALLGFTISDDKNSKREWISRVVKELFEFKDTQNFLRNYQVYPDQLGEFKYASQLKKEEDNMPPRLKEIYNVICRNDGNRIEKELVDKAFAPFLIDAIELKAQELADVIQTPFKGENGKRSIATDIHQNLYIEIIERFNSKEEGVKWRELFSLIFHIRPLLMLSVIDSPQKQDSIFSIMKVEDETKLQKIAELAKDPNFDRIVKLGREAFEKEERDHNDLMFKKELGNDVENILQKELKEILGNNALKVPTVENEQGGQDLVIQLNGETVYYIEVKSRWSTDKSVLMSTLQHRTSYEHKDHYSLCAADMTSFMEQARNHKYPPFADIESHLSFLPNIGSLNERLKDATSENNQYVHVAGGYQVLVSQDVIRDNRITFRNFIEYLKQYIRQLL